MKKRILKWTVGILLAPIVLFFILAALLYVPAIQDFAVRKATAYAAEATGMDVHIGQLRLTFLFDINLQEVQVTDKEEDTLLDVEQLTVDLSFSSIFRGEIDVEGIKLTQASVDTKSLIESVAIRGHIGHFYVDSHGIKLPQETVTVSTASLSDADVDIALGHSETTDTTSSVVNWKIILPKVDLARTRLRLSMPGDSMRVEAGIVEEKLVEEGAKVEDAVVMGGTVIKAGAVVEHCIVAENVVIGENAVVGAMPKDGENGVATVGSGVYIGDNAKVGPNAMVNNNVKDGEEQW